MKIETWLQPNCSEAVICVVDWDGKEVISSYETSSEGTDAESEIERIKDFMRYIKNGYEVNINANGTSMFNNELEMADDILKNNLEIDNWEGLIDAFFNSSGPMSVANMKKYEDKVKRFARGGFKHDSKKRTADNNSAGSSE